MLTYIYKAPGEEFSLTACPQKLFELLTVADKYEILSLRTLAVDALGSLTISNENMVFVANVAKNYKSLFEEESQDLLLKCLKFIATGGGRDTFTLISETQKNFPDASFDVLHELINVGKETLQLPGVKGFRFRLTINVLQVGVAWSSLTLRSTSYMGRERGWPQFLSWKLRGRFSGI